MKREATSKIKFKRLQRRLKLTQWQAVGILESIWHVAYNNAPAGDIGKLSNEDIAAAIEWDGDADELVAALIECEWIDVDTVYRLIIHDWSKHCGNSLVGSFRKHDRLFADEEYQLRRSQAECQAPSQAEHREESQAGCQVDTPYHTIPDQTKPPAGDGRESFINGTFPPAFEMWWTTYPPSKRTKKTAAFTLWQGVCSALDRRGVEDPENWLIRRLREFCKSPASKGKYCPGAEKWLADGRYDDEDEAWSGASETVGTKPKVQGIADPNEEYNPNARF